MDMVVKLGEEMMNGGCLTELMAGGRGKKN